MRTHVCGGRAVGVAQVPGGSSCPSSQRFPAAPSGFPCRSTGCVPLLPGALISAGEILYSANANHSPIRNVKFGHASGINCSGLISLSGNVGIILPHDGFEKVSYLMLTIHAKENGRGKKKVSLLKRDLHRTE